MSTYRAYAGLGVRRDPDMALGCFINVATGPYPHEKCTLGYSLACHAVRVEYIVAHADETDPGDTLWRTAVFAECSAENGLFSYACLAMAWMLDWIDDLEDKRNFKELVSFWKSYADYRLATGTQRPSFIPRCTTCKYKPDDSSLLKRCGGPCSVNKKTKPMYCGRKCQVQVGGSALI